MKKISEPRIKEIAGLYGYRLREFSDDDADDIIAKDFEERANGFLDIYNEEEYSRYKKGICVAFRFVDQDETAAAAGDPGFDVLVAPVSGKGMHRFVILVSIKILRGLTTLFTAMSAGTEGSLSGVTPDVTDEKFESEIYPRILCSLIFIFFHEFSHIVRAHIPFYFGELYDKRYKNQLLSFHLIRDVSAGDIDRIRIHRAMEIDADLLAIGLILEFVSNNNLDKAFLFTETLVNRPDILGESIYILMRLMELWRRTITGAPYDEWTSMHPHPDIRQIFLEAWLLARKEEDRGEQFISATQKFKEGADLALKKIKEFGDQFLPELEYLIGKGLDSSLEEYDILRVDLYDFLKPALTSFSVE